MDPSSFTIPTAADIERMADDLRWSISELCRRADVTESTFYHWRAKQFEINIGIAKKLLTALKDGRRVAP